MTLQRTITCGGQSRKLRYGYAARVAGGLVRVDRDLPEPNGLTYQQWGWTAIMAQPTSAVIDLIWYRLRIALSDSLFRVKKKTVNFVMIMKVIP